MHVSLNRSDSRNIRVEQPHGRLRRRLSDELRNSLSAKNRRIIRRSPIGIQSKNDDIGRNREERNSTSISRVYRVQLARAVNPIV